MKTILPFILTVLTSFTSFSQQTFAPIGTKWYYSIGALDDQSGLVQNQNCIIIESIKDTTMNGDDVRQLEVTRIHPDRSTEKISKEYIKQTGDSIYYFNPFSNQFIQLYDFSLAVLDTLTIHKEKTRVPAGFFTDSVSYVSYIIDSVDSILVNNTLIKRQRIVNNDSDLSNWCMTLSGTLTGDEDNNYILENYGSTAYLFGYTRFFHLESMPTLLRCIEYNGTILYKNQYWDKDCDYTRLYNGVEEFTRSQNIQLSPNPASSSITLPSNTYEKVAIYNQLGQLVTTNNYPSATISISDLESGLFYVIAIDKQGTSYYGKFIKQ